MRAVIQRVSEASVTINYSQKRSIGPGLVVLLGVAPDDQEEDLAWMAGKIPALRIFEDPEGKMNLSVKDIQGDIMVVSQFTLFASTRKGNRPGFSLSAPPAKAIPLYQEFIRRTEEFLGRPVPTGEFGAHMDLDIMNNGPVTIILDSKNRE